MYVTLNMNAKLQPIHRHELEDTFDKFLKKTKLGMVVGGGTLLSEGGEISCCDIEFKIKRANKKRMGLFLKIMETFNPPKGSMLCYKKNQIPIGKKEGLSLYLNGHELEEDIYKNCSIDVVIEKLNESMKDIGEMYSYFEGQTGTTLYFYGTSFIEMETAIQPFIGEYPLCQKCIVKKIT